MSPEDRLCDSCRVPPAARRPTETRSRPRSPGRSRVPRGSTSSTSMPPSGVGPTPPSLPTSSGAWTSPSRCPAGSVTTSRCAQRSPPAAPESTSARPRWRTPSGAPLLSRSTATGWPSASTYAAPLWPRAAGRRRAVSSSTSSPASTPKAVPATSSPTSSRTGPSADPTSTCCARCARRPIIRWSRPVGSPRSPTSTRRRCDRRKGSLLGRFHPS